MRVSPTLTALCVLGVLTGAPAGSTPLSAQAIPVLAPGTRVRVDAPEVQRRRMEGTVHAMDTTRLVLLIAGDADRSITIPLASLARVDVGTARTRARAAARGVGIGGLIGAGIGLGVALVGIVADPYMTPPPPSGYFELHGDFVSLSNGEILAIFMVGGAIAGATVGGLQGIVAPGWVWENRWRTAQLSVGPAGNATLEARYVVRF
jgi:hypothetical protein